MIPRLTLDIGWKDLGHALVAGRDAGAAERIAAMAPAGRTAVVCLSVRTALDALLSELALPAGSEVLMSAVNIQNMADIVRAHGLTVVAVDIALEDLAPTPEALEAAVTGRSRLFLLAHLFGARVPTEALATVCRRHGLMFVEDCAQAYDGVLDASTGTDVSLYSFGPIKTATALGGAVALVADASLGRAMSRRLASYPATPSGWWTRRLLKHAALKLASGRMAYGLVLRLLGWLGHGADSAIGAAARGFPGADLLGQLRRRPPDGLLALLARRLAAPPRERLETRTARARRLAGPLGGAVPGRANRRHAWWLFPVLSDDPDRHAAVLRSQGFDATRGATSLRALDGAPNAQHLMRQVLYLPISTPLTEAEERRLSLAGRGAAQPIPNTDAYAIAESVHEQA